MTDKIRTGSATPAVEVMGLRAQLAALQADHDDLRLLNEAMIEHSEAVEDQLAAINLALQATQKRLEAELDDAARYVMSIVPKPRQVSPLTDWQLIPSTELGGDTFGYHAINEDNLAVYLIDVCGHGVGAALLSVTIVNVLRTSGLSGANFLDPSNVLEALNDTFPMERQNDMYFTIWYGVYQQSSGLLQYATGGHPPAIHLRTEANGEVRSTFLATPGGIAIGAMEGMSFNADSIQLAPGDRILVLSDGTFEVDVDDGMLSIEDLAAFATDTSDDPARIRDWVRSLAQPGPLPDDFTLLRLRF